MEYRSAAAMLLDSPRSAAAGLGVGGVAVPYDSDSQPLPFIEAFSPSAFADQLGDVDGFAGVTGQFQHDQTFVLASVDSGTMQVVDAPDGLRFTMQLPASLAYVREVIQSGIVAGASIGFQTISDEWSVDPLTGDPRRYVTRAVLGEISLVARPAYAAATASVTAGPMRSTRAGRVLSGKTRDVIQSAIGHLTAGRHALAGETLRQLLADADGPDAENLIDQALESDSVEAVTELGSLTVEAARRQMDERVQARVEADMRRHLLRGRELAVQAEAR